MVHETLCPPASITPQSINLVVEEGHHQHTHTFQHTVSSVTDRGRRMSCLRKSRLRSTKCRCVKPFTTRLAAFVPTTAADEIPKHLWVRNGSVISCIRVRCAASLPCARGSVMRSCRKKFSYVLLGCGMREQQHRRAVVRKPPRANAARRAPGVLSGCRPSTEPLQLREGSGVGLLTCCGEEEEEGGGGLHCPASSFLMLQMSDLPQPLHNLVRVPDLVTPGLVACPHGLEARRVPEEASSETCWYACVGIELDDRWIIIFISHPIVAWTKLTANNASCPELDNNEKQPSDQTAPQRHKLPGPPHGAEERNIVQRSTSTVIPLDETASSASRHRWISTRVHGETQYQE